MKTYSCSQFALTGGPPEVIYVSVGQMRIVVAVLMAYAVLVILVSPAVPSPATTLPSRHSVHPPQFVVPVAVLLFTAAVDPARAWQWMTAAPPIQRASSGSELVDLTGARLC